MVMVIVYVVLSLMVAFLGRRTRLGFFRGLLFSIMLTPFLVMLYLLISMSLDLDDEKASKDKQTLDSNA